MVFRPERYPAEWSAIRARILERAEDACECRGECGSSEHRVRVHPGDDSKLCGVPNGALVLRDAFGRWGRFTGSDESAREYGAVRIVLTVAHVDHDERNSDPSNLLALCQRCHLALDRSDNARRARETRDARRGPKLPGLE